VLDAFAGQHRGQQPWIAFRAVVHGAERSDQGGSGGGGQPVPQRFRLQDGPRIEGVRVGVAEDPGGAVGAGIVAGGDVAFQDGDLVAAGGELPGGGGAGQAGAHHHKV
jgi:hypothetical protein